MNLRYEARKFILNEIDIAIDNKSNKLPSERKLAEKYNLSRVTLRSALSDLEREGKIIRKRGSGTFVSPNSSDMKIDLFRMKTYGQIIKENNYKLGIIALETKIVETPDFVKKTKLYNNDQMVMTSRVYFADQMVAAICIDFLNISYRKDINAISNYSSSIYNYLLESKKIELTTASIRFLAVDRNDIKYFINIDEDLIPDKCILIKSIEYDSYNNPSLFTREYVNTDIIPVTTIRKRKGRL